MAAAGLLLVVGGCAGRGEAWTHGNGAENPLVGTIHDVAAGRAIRERELVARLAEQEFVLVGDAAGNADHARIAARLVRELAGEGRRLAAVALGPLPSDAQPRSPSTWPDTRATPPASRPSSARRPPTGRSSPAGARGGLGGRGRRPARGPGPAAQALRGVLTHGLKALQPAFVQRTGLTAPCRRRSRPR
jgi:hypothetical protein